MLWLRRPKISVIVAVYKMQREAPRTLRSLALPYQQGVHRKDYEVIVVENRSDQMLSAKQVRAFGRQFRYYVNPDSSPSPASAMNLGAAKARGQTLLVMIDGARIASPGVLRHTLTAGRLYYRPVIVTLAWHLGPDNQARSIHLGYCRSVEDQLLSQSGWEQNGYQLFTISALAGSCSKSWFFPISESNCLAVDRSHYKALGGFSEEFQTPGGGFVNLDFYSRVVADPKRPLVVLLGEGTFHQVHGGVATNRRNDEPLQEFQAEYHRLRKRPFDVPQTNPVFYGTMPEQAKKFMRLSVAGAEEIQRSCFPSLAAATAQKPSVASVESAGAVVGSPSSQILTVLGMHRSGTSCLAGTLMECSVDFGDVSRTNKYNLKGNNENQQIMDFHDRLLTQSGGAWNNPPTEVRWTDACRKVRDSIVAQFRAKNTAWWGFKDPRTLFTLEGWQETAPEMRLVGIFRHPESVVQSLMHRNQYSREQGLDLWLRYNRRLLAVHRRQPFPILFFSDDRDEFFRQLHDLTACMGLQPPAGGFQFYEPILQHFQPAADATLPAEVADVYQQLHAAAIYRPEVQRRFTTRTAAAA